MFGINDFNPFILGGSEDAGWNKPGDGISVDHVSDWPVLTSTSISLNTSPTTSSIVTTSGDMMITLHDDLETVLERLGLGKYYHLFQVCSCIHTCTVQGRKQREYLPYECNAISLHASYNHGFILNFL